MIYTISAGGGQEGKGKLDKNICIYKHCRTCYDRSYKEETEVEK